MAESKNIYAVGGAVQASGGVYIERAADAALLELCRAGKLAFILSSRQVGKSSLMVHTAQQLEKDGIRTAIVDLSAIGVTVSAEEWYLGILNEIANGLGLQTDIFRWWADHAQLGLPQRLGNFFREVLLQEVRERVILFFDEIDTTLSIAEKLGSSCTDDFFTALRATYNARPTIPDFERLSFVLIGVASPSELIADSRRTPFNIGQRVEVTDFTLEEARPLAEGLQNGPPQVLEWVFEWTGGHPYLTQRLCATLAQQPGRLTRESVAKVVQDIFMGESGQQDTNLQFVRDMLLRRADALVEEVLSIYEQILQKKKVEDDERSLSKVHLKLAGVVRRAPPNLLRVSNQIYARVFNLQWVGDHLSPLRIKNPLQSRALEWDTKKDPSFLLRGKELAEAEQLLLQNELPEVRGTRIVQDFISSSRKNQEQIRNRILFGLGLVAIVMVSLAVFAWVQRTSAVSAQSAAENARSTALVGVETREFAVTSAVQALQTSYAESTRVANAQATSNVLERGATLIAALAQESVKTLSKSLALSAPSRMEINHIHGLLLGVESFRFLENYALSQGQYPDALPPLLDEMPRGLVRHMELSSGVVRKILYAPNGKLMVTMSDTVDLWNTTDPASPAILTGWESSSLGQPSDVAFSPNSRLIVVGYQDGRVEIWSVNSPNVMNLATWNEFSSPVNVSVSPDNNVLAVAGDQMIKFWDISNPRSPQPKGSIETPHEISDRRVDVSYVGFAPGSTAPLLLSGGIDSYLHLWNLGKYNYNPPEFIGNQFEFDTATPHVAISDKFLIIADTKSIRVFTYSNSARELNDTEPYGRVHQGAIESLVISPDNTRLYTTAQDGAIVEWDLSDPRHIRSVPQPLRGRMSGVVSLAYHPERNILAAGGNNSTVAIWELDERNLAHLWHDQIPREAVIKDVAYSPALNLLAVGDDEGGIVFWDVTDPSAIKRRRPPNAVHNPVHQLAFSPDDKMLLIMGDFTTEAVNPRAYSRDVTRLDFSEYVNLFGTDTAEVFAVGNHFVLGGETANGVTSIFSWDISRKEIIRDPALGSTECPFRDTAYTQNGDLVAVAACNVQLWDFSDENMPTMRRELDSVDPRGVAFNADGTLLTSANGNSTISIWRLDPNGVPEQLPPISAHGGSVTSVAISPDGKTLASGGEDQDIILWDITDPASPLQRVVLKGHTNAVLNGAIFFLPDGKTLISASQDEVIFWDLDPQSWIDKACSLAGRNFTPSEWGQFVGRAIPYEETCPGLPAPEN
ncbi:MAG TPA: AAA-like domain-containing protein [Anaerolineales bacterium]|nr:AAA-like domain-containing protein [Anaerolineales bacterium]